jgi:septal ring factor EnvC (AmiA/AmiB activator)
VVPPYNLAYSVFQNDIINPLLNVTNTSITSKLANTLNCGALAFNDNLSQAMEGSDAIRTKIDETIIESVQAISEWENKIKQSEKDLAALLLQITSTEKQVDIAEQGVKEKEAGLARANADVQAAEQAMEDAMNCNRKRRRRKRFLNVTVFFLYFSTTDFFCFIV